MDFHFTTFNLEINVCRKPFSFSIKRYVINKKLSCSTKTWKKLYISINAYNYIVMLSSKSWNTFLIFIRIIIWNLFQQSIKILHFFLCNDYYWQVLEVTVCHIWWFSEAMLKSGYLKSLPHFFFGIQFSFTTFCKTLLSHNIPFS